MADRNAGSVCALVMAPVAPVGVDEPFEPSDYRIPRTVLLYVLAAILAQSFAECVIAHEQPKRFHELVAVCVEQSPVAGAAQFDVRRVACAGEHGGANCKTLEQWLAE